MSAELHDMVQPEALDQLFQLLTLRSFAPNDDAHILIPAPQQGGSVDEVGEPLFGPEVGDGPEDTDSPGVTGTLKSSESDCVDPVRNDNEKVRANSARLPHPHGGGL